MRTRLAIKAVEAALHGRDVQEVLDQMSASEAQEFALALIDLSHKVIADRKARIAAAARPVPLSEEDVARIAVHMDKNYRDRLMIKVNGVVGT